MPFDNRRTHLSPTGARLNLYTRRAQGETRGVIQVNHGIAEHAARYQRFADAMAAHGFHNYAHDHRGHGYTEAPDAPPRVFGQVEAGVPSRNLRRGSGQACVRRVYAVAPRRRIIAARRHVMTSSPFWFLARCSKMTMPHCGRDFDSRFSTTSVSA